MDERQSRIDEQSAVDAERWYALRVRSRHEKVVQRALQHRGYHEFLPLYLKNSQWSDRNKEVQVPLFPGYVFSQFNFTHRLYILSIPGVLHIVGNGNIAAAVQEHELEAIKRSLALGRAVTPHPFLQVGQRVVVQRGSLTGVEGILLDIKGQSRLIISVALLQRSVAIQIPRDWVKPTHGPSAAGTPRTHLCPESRENPAYGAAAPAVAHGYPRRPGRGTEQKRTAS
jgi:transcription antitermination factor NusG